MDNFEILKIFEFRSQPCVGCFFDAEHNYLQMTIQTTIFKRVNFRPNSIRDYPNLLPLQTRIIVVSNFATGGLRSWSPYKVWKDLQNPLIFPTSHRRADSWGQLSPVMPSTPTDPTTLYASLPLIPSDSSRADNLAVPIEKRFHAIESFAAQRFLCKVSVAHPLV